MAVFRDRPPLTTGEIIASIIVFSLIFEWLFPALSNDFTGDIKDVVAYFVGGLLYYWAQQFDGKG